MRSKRSRTVGDGQHESQGHRGLVDRMGAVGFVAGTQTAYLRAFDRFEARLDRKTAQTATVSDARRYLSGLRQSGVSQTAYSHAAAALRFFFEEVRGLVWNPISPLRQRMIDDMHLHRFSAKTQASYVRSVDALTRYHGRSPAERRGYPRLLRVSDLRAQAGAAHGHHRPLRHQVLLREDAQA